MKEIDYIILLSISIYGDIALPQDYYFLKRYHLISYYNEITIRKSSSNYSIEFLNNALKEEAKLLADKLNVNKHDIKELSRKYDEEHVKKNLLHKNRNYIKTYKSILK